MKVEKIDNAKERRAVTAMIVDKGTLGRIAPHWSKEGLFDSPWSNILGSWCVKYFNKYGEAPNKNIEGLLRTHAEKVRDKSTVDLLDRFVSDLSGEYRSARKEIVTSYAVDNAARLFNQVSLKKLKNRIGECLEDGEFDKADALIQSHRKIELSTGAGVNILTDKENIKAAFKAKGESLIRYSGALGEFFADAFEPDSFVSFMSPQKRGKSFWLLDVTWRAMLQGLKVCYFVVGDMSMPQVTMRVIERASRHPKKARTVRWPKSIVRDPDEKYATVRHDDIVYPHRINRIRAEDAFERVIERQESRGSSWKTECYPSGAIGVAGIKSVIQGWERGKRCWSPDVVVLDYADNLAPPTGFAASDSIGKIAENWSQLRALSQYFHCCLITATQANATAAYAEELNRTHFSGARQKIDQVTALIGINQTGKEKSDDITRLNMIVLRGDESDESTFVHVAACRSLANIAVKSCW